MPIPIVQVDAFTDRPFHGNPAAVCPLESWLDDERMQAIAAENNLSETAYLVREKGDYRIRWFTPAVEVDLCGHATLASAHVVLTLLEPERQDVTFHSASGQLHVRRTPEGLAMDLPSRPPEPCEPCAGLLEAMGRAPEAVLGAQKYLLVYPDEATVRGLAPDMAGLMDIDRDGVIVTAPGDAAGLDFVSRYFVPAAGIPEDPVTGSAHCTLTPYWTARLNKAVLRAKQVSERGGDLICEQRGDRVQLTGSCVTVMRGTIEE